MARNLAGRQFWFGGPQPGRNVWRKKWRHGGQANKNTSDWRARADTA